MLLCIADDRRRADDQQPSQVSITLLGDAAEPVLAAGRMLLGHQPNPGGKVAPRCKRLPVANLGNHSRGDNRADAWNLRQPPARLARAMPSQDALVDGSDLGSDRAVLPRQHIENAAGGRGNPVVLGVSDDAEQLSCSVAALGRHDAEFGQVPA